MDLGLLVVRLAVGMLMMGHGAQKLFGSFGGHGPAGTGGFFESLGLTPGRQMAILAGVGELVGGALLAVGLLTPLSAALLSAVLLTAAWTAHRAAGIWIAEGGYEYNLVLITGLFALTAVGPGEWSLDNSLGIDANGTGWALAELGAALVATVGAVLIGRSSLGRVSAVGPAADATAGKPLEPEPAASAAPVATRSPQSVKVIGSTGIVVWLEARPGREAEAAQMFEEDVFLDRDFFPRAAGRRIRPSDRLAAALRSDGEGIFAEPLIERADRPPA
jgi:putative oxidoreductase